MVKAKLSRLRSDPVRVAAFCFSNLKRAQVLDTDISSAVDKILQKEMDVESYRVLGYLLLGIIRIYSKKVEYALDDCNEVLVEINKFVVNNNTVKFARVETLRMSVTIPDRLELDAFELDELEDAGRGHTAPQEEITLKDKEVVCKTEGFGLFSHEKFEEFDVGENTSSFDHDIVGNAFLAKLLDMMDIEVSPQNSPTDLPESRDEFQSSIFLQKEPMNIDSVIIVKELEKESVNLSGQDQRIIEDRTVEDIDSCEDEIHEESSRISQEESIDISFFSGREKEHVLPVETFNESHQVDTDHSSAKETSSSLCIMNQETIEVHEARSFQESIEKPQDEKSYENEGVCHGNSSVTNEIHGELIEGPVEKHDNKGKLGFQEKVSLEDERLSVIPPKSKNNNATPQSKFQGDSVGRPKRDSTTPESMHISTPAVREHPPFSRKRRVGLDRMIVLPNEVVRKSLSDTKDLVRLPNKSCLPKESRRTLLTAHCVQRQRESSISSLPNRFYEPLLPCSSSELQLILSKKKMKIPKSLRIVETSQNLDVSQSPTVDTPLSHSQSSCSLEIDETPEMLDVPEPQASGIPKQIATVSQTPASCPRENIEIEEVPNLMDEETNSCGANDSELLAGWSGRTRKVASCLHHCFLRARKQREEDTVNFSQVFGGRARKESARFFYEVLVLKTTGYVDVEQNEAYGDIAISKLPKLDQTF